MGSVGSSTVRGEMLTTRPLLMISEMPRTTFIMPSVTIRAGILV